MSGKARFRWWAIAWVVSLLVMGILTFPFSIVAPYIVFWFPTGLLRLAGLRMIDRSEGLILLAWAPYLILTFLAFAMPTRRSFLWFFLALCVLLLLNVAGCTLRVSDAASQPAYF
jgi:hypothetical protein